MTTGTAGLADVAFDAVVLAGGAARRLGGASKPDVVVAGRTLLDHALDATRGARHVVVVGPPGLARPGVVVTREDPPGGGPAAGIAAGLAALAERTAPDDDAPVLVLACDVPQAAAVVPALLAALTPDVDGAHLVDAGGRAQLVAVHRRAALVRALAALGGPPGVHGVAVRRLHEHLVMARLADVDGRGADADTWDDVERLDALLAGAPRPVTSATTGTARPTHRRDPMDATPPDAPEPTPTADALLAAPPSGPVLRGSDLHRWVASVADVLGVDPDALDVDTLLDVTRDVAHSVARPAVPLTAFLAGYAVATSGGGREAFDRVVDRVGALAAEWAAAVEQAQDEGGLSAPGPAGPAEPVL